MGIIDEAIHLLALGLTPIPLCGPECQGHTAGGKKHSPERGGKVPLGRWRPSDAQALTAVDLRAKFGAHPGANLGLALGGADRLVALDVDGPDGAAFLRRLCGSPPPPTWTVATGRGEHRYYLWPDAAPPASTHQRLTSDVVSFIGHGGYTVVPPSVHRSGRAYTWRAGPAPAARPIATLPDEIVAWVRGRKQRKQGTSGGVGAPARPPASATQLKRARGYARRRPHAVLGQGGRAQAWAVAVDIAGKFRLDEEQLLDVLVECWGPRCVPPWTDRDHLRYHIGRAAALTVVPPLPERPLPAPPAASLAGGNTHDATPADPPVRIHVPARPAPEGPSAARGDPAGYDAGNSRKRDYILLSEAKEAPLGWLEDGWIPLGTLTLVCGPPSAGKSTFGARLARLAGRTILLPEPGEDLWRGSLARFRRAGVDLSAVRVLTGGDWALPCRAERLAAHIREHSARLVWFDAIDAQCADVKESLREEVQPLLESLGALAARTGCAVVAGRHPGKDPTNINPGSRCWGSIPRCVLEVVIQPGPPIKRILRLHRDSNNVGQPPRYFRLVGEKRSPPVWEWDDEASEDTVALAREPRDTVDRWKHDEAIDWLRRLLRDGPLDTGKVYGLGLRQGFNDRILRRAAREMGLHRWPLDTGERTQMIWSLTARTDSPDSPDSA